MIDSTCSHIASSGGSSIWDTTSIVGLFTIFATAVLFYLGNRVQAKSKLNENLNNLLNLGIQYPNLERNSFIANTSDPENDEESMRYNLYCIAWFNHLQEIYLFHFGNAKSVQNHFTCNEVVNTHKKWWLDNSKANYDGYSPKFVKFIQSMIE